MPVQASDDPFTMVYSTLFEQVALQPLFKDYVKDGNCLRFDINKRNIIKPGAQAADFPEVMLMSDGIVESNLYRTSSTSSLIRRYVFWVSTADYRIAHFLFPVEWAIWTGMVGWQKILTTLQFNSKSFVKNAQVTDASEATLAIEQNKEIAGWSALWGVAVEMHFDTKDILALLEIPNTP